MTNCIFEPRTDTSSATICKHCGQEKFLHIQLPQQETLYTEEQVREALFYALNVNKTTCCTTRTTDSIVRETIQSLNVSKG